MRLNELGLTRLVGMLKSGEVTPFEVAEDTVAAVSAGDESLHGFLDFYADDLLAEAKEITRSDSYRNTPLGGAPVAVKDNICIEGRSTTCGSKILASWRSPYNATVVEKLRAGGALIAGKTNLDEFAMGSSTENSAFGPTHNPWDNGCVAGGSSGGSAAVVAAHMVTAALGSDTGGSIRQPASFCGVVGMKPTYGRVSRYGLVAFASSLDQIGPFTRSVEDCALMLNVICGHDPCDSTSLRVSSPDFTEGLERALDGLVVGVPWDFISGGMDPEVEKNFRAVVDRLEAEGVRVVDVSLAQAKYAVSCYYIIANAEASSNLARYDGVKYGHRSTDADHILSMYTRTRDEGFGDEVKRRILLGTYVLSAGYYDAYYVKAQKVRSLIIGAFNEAYTKCDVILSPTAPTPAFKIGAHTDDPLSMYLADAFTIPVNLAGLPAVSIPIGLSAAGLPIGAQLIGRALDEVTLLGAARGLETLVGFKEVPHV